MLHQLFFVSQLLISHDLVLALVVEQFLACLLNFVL